MLSKFGLKVAALVLVGTVSAMAQAPMDIDPEDWNYLSNFKLWGTEGISFGNRPEFYDSRLYDREKMKMIILNTKTSIPIRLVGSVLLRATWPLVKEVGLMARLL